EECEQGVGITHAKWIARHNIIYQERHHQKTASQAKKSLLLFDGTEVALHESLQNSQESPRDQNHRDQPELVSEHQVAVVNQVVRHGIRRSNPFPHDPGSVRQKIRSRIPLIDTSGKPRVESAIGGGKSQSLINEVIGLCCPSPILSDKDRRHQQSCCKKPPPQELSPLVLSCTQDGHSRDKEATDKNSYERTS